MSEDTAVITSSLIAIALIAFIVWHSRVRERRAELALWGERSAAARLAFARALWQHHGLKVETTAIQVVLDQDDFILCAVPIPPEYGGALGGTTVQGRYLGTGHCGHVVIMDENAPNGYRAYTFDRIPPDIARQAFAETITQLGTLADPALITTATETVRGMECTFRFQDGQDVQAHGFCRGNESGGTVRIIGCRGLSGDLVQSHADFKYEVSSDGSVHITPTEMAEN